MTKKNIAKLISKKIHIPESNASNILEYFLLNIKNNAQNKSIKINNFGSFQYKTTPKRVGRNPKTGEVHEIKSFQRFIFKPSINLKLFIN